MPSASAATTLSRQRELLKHIPSRLPGKTSAEIRDALSDEGFDIHERSVQRDLKTLQRHYRITRTKEPPYRWYWESKQAYDDMLATASEGITVLHAFTLHMLRIHLAQTLPAATTRQMKPLFDLAESKLAALADSNEIARWTTLVDVVKPGLPANAPSLRDGVLEEVQSALMKRDKLKLEYASASQGTCRQFMVNPIGIVQRGEKIYLVAIEEGYAKPTTYAMHRIMRANSYWQSADTCGISLDSFITSGGLQFLVSPNPVPLRAWVSKMLGDQLAETNLDQLEGFEPQSLTQLERKDDGYELIVTLPDSLTLRNWILSWTGHIEVFEPNTLREEIVVALREGAQRYS